MILRRSGILRLLLRSLGAGRAGARERDSLGAGRDGAREIGTLLHGGKCFARLQQASHGGTSLVHGSSTNAKRKSGPKWGQYRDENLLGEVAKLDFDHADAPAGRIALKDERRDQHRLRCSTSNLASRPLQRFQAKWPNRVEMLSTNRTHFVCNPQITAPGPVEICSFQGPQDHGPRPMLRSGRR